MDAHLGVHQYFDLNNHLQPGIYDLIFDLNTALSLHNIALVNGFETLIRTGFLQGRVETSIRSRFQENVKNFLDLVAQLIQPLPPPATFIQLCKDEWDFIEVYFAKLPTVYNYSEFHNYYSNYANMDLRPLYTPESDPIDPTNILAAFII